MKKFIVLVIILHVSNCLLFGQSNKISIYKESKIRIINLMIDQNINGLPLLTFTIINKTKENIIFSKVLLSLSEIKRNPTSSSSDGGLISRALTPITGLDLTLPQMENTYLFSIRSPIEIVSKDAASIQIRLHCDYKHKTIAPRQIGIFKFKLTFLTYDNKGIESREILIGDTI